MCANFMLNGCYMAEYRRKMQSDIRRFVALALYTVIIFQWIIKNPNTSIVNVFLRKGKLRKKQLDPFKGPTSARAIKTRFKLHVHHDEQLAVYNENITVMHTDSMKTEIKQIEGMCMVRHLPIEVKEMIT